MIAEVLGQVPVIELMRHEHLESVLAIERACFSTPWSLDAYLGELRHPATEYRIARVENRIVGYAGLWLIIDEAHITTMAVHPDFRGRKIGEWLLHKQMERAHETGMVRGILEVRAGNIPAQRLYEKYGFKVISVRKNYYSDDKEDAFIMWAEGVHKPEYGHRLHMLREALLNSDLRGNDAALRD